MAHSARSVDSRDADHALEPAADDNDASSLGFDIHLPSAQLGDLIQINCLNRIRGAFRVMSGSRQGLLFFDAGQLVHAAAEAQLGLDAVVLMLGWRGGSIEPCAPPWPAVCSIGMGADALLLQAAQRLDERSRPSAPPEEVTTKVVRRVALPARAPARDEPPAGPARASDHSGLSLRGGLSLDSLARLEVARVAADGNIEHLRPGTSTELADTAFYCHTLASLVGEGLGLGPARALACQGLRHGLVVFAGRSIVGARGVTADLSGVRAKVGLD